ncbi:hypothetical protein CHS0354_030996 [Potamilus streckersoni]|uniref:Uncharacterized protein n=1 Tax=Potamilus streckersoni TaxID=2493646 RepID=A0AAE0VNP3_9BIVA|nr:hypothetical protein CHS0354_030996 [Potamilus streckersoni]
MATRDDRFWSALEKKAKLWVDNSEEEPSMVMFYLPRASKSKPVPQIKYFASSNMKQFVEDKIVQSKFVEACEKRIEVERPKKLKVFYPRDPDTYTMDDLRILASCLVREEVSFKHGVSRDFWGISIYRQDWWPADVKLQSPHERRKVCVYVHMHGCYGMWVGSVVPQSQIQIYIKYQLNYL